MTQCARHPESESVGTCDRCGDFFCVECRSTQRDAHCGSCGSNLGYAWERRRGWIRPFLATLLELLARPRRGWPGPTSARSAIAFGAIALVIVWSRKLLSLGLSAYSVGPYASSFLLEMLPTLALTGLFWLATMGLSCLTYWGACRALGARPKWADVLRLAAFATGVELFRIPWNLFMNSFVAVVLLVALGIEVPLRALGLASLLFVVALRARLAHSAAHRGAGLSKTKAFVPALAFVLPASAIACASLLVQVVGGGPS